MSRSVVLLVAWFIQSRTAIGRNFYAVGGGEDLAHASGLNVRRVRVIGFMLAGVFYAFGSLFAVAQIGIAETATGYNFMFVSITSVVVGGTALWAGNGGAVWNTLVGVLIVNVINNRHDRHRPAALRPGRVLGSWSSPPSCCRRTASPSHS